MDAIVTQPAARAAIPRDAGKPRPSREEAENAVRTLLAYIGEDPDREGLAETPRRVVKAYDQMFDGYAQDGRADLSRVFEEVGGYEDIVLVRDIPFFSHCEHHMVPFHGKVHAAYYPTDGVVGLSKIARVVDIYARRLQTQENLTSEIAQAMEDALKPRGIALLVEAEHMCMSMRGIRKAGVTTLTTHFSGVFRDDPAEQVRFLTLVRTR